MIETREKYIEDFCKNFVDEFAKNHDDWTKQDGYRNKSEAARMASIYLLQLSKVQNNDQLKKFYTAQVERYINERTRVFKSKRW